MNSRRLVQDALRALVLLSLLGLGRTAAAQALTRPQPTCVRGVLLGLSGEERATLLLRDGAIEAVLDAEAPTPAGMRIVEGEGLRCLPAFVDAFSRQGLAMRQPVKDQDLPPDELADVGVDMRQANRKGIQPSFQAVEALAVTTDQSLAWRKSGFGAVLVAPTGELLAGSSALVTTREAAMRDLVLRDAVFAHAAFAASGPGYPSTLMGDFAQLRQFLMDARRHVELARRYQEGRPGLRPPYDAELHEGAVLVEGHTRLVCEAQGLSEIDRWLRLAGEFDLSIAVAGGREAWRLAEDLRLRDVPVLLTLDWGKEVDDPRPKADQDEPKESAAEPEQKAEEKPEKSLEYVEPYPVRLERREKWEEGRDCALRLHEAGVRFAFGSASDGPADLLAHVRALVEHGLPAEVALQALTTGAAELLGAGDRLGRLEPGLDATFTLWRGDPLTEEKASVAWIFVDGFPTEFKEEKKREGAPAEGVTATGTWKLVFDTDEGPRTATLVLEMDAKGGLSGTLEVENPMTGTKASAQVEGGVFENEVEFEASIDFGDFTLEARLVGTLSGDDLDGQGHFKGPWSDEPMTQDFRGKRVPQ